MKRFLAFAFFAVALLGICGSLHAQAYGSGVPYNIMAPDPTVMIQGSQVAICLVTATGHYPCGTPVTVYSNANLTTTITNPLTPTAAGTTIYVAPSATPYEIEYYGPNVTPRIQIVTLNNTAQNFTAILGTAYTNATTVMSNVTGLAFPVSANTSYHGSCHIAWQNGTSNDAIQYQFTGPASPTAVMFGLVSAGTTGGGAAGATIVNKVATAFASALTQSLTTVTATTNFLDDIEISVVNGSTAGTVQLQAAALTGGTVTIAAGSFCSVQ